MGTPLPLLCVSGGRQRVNLARSYPGLGVCCCHALCAPARGADSRDLTWGQEDGGSLLVLLRLSSQQALRACVQRGAGALDQSAQAAITKYLRLGGFNNSHVFSQFWNLKVQDQGARQGGVW